MASERRRPTGKMQKMNRGRQRRGRALAAALGIAATLACAHVAQCSGAGPGGVSADLALWLRADVGLTVEAERVSKWEDQSGNGRDATQSDSAARPYLATLNDLPVLMFRNSVSLDFDANFLVDSDYTIIVVDAKRVNRQSNYYIGGSAQSAYSNLILGYSGLVTIRQTDTSEHLDAEIGPVAAERFVWAAYLLDGNDGRRILWNGAEVASDASPRALQSFPGAAIGRVSAYDHFFNGYIAEIIIYTRALCDAELYALGEYIQSTYGAANLRRQAQDDAAQNPTFSKREFVFEEVLGMSDVSDFGNNMGSDHDLHIYNEDYAWSHHLPDDADGFLEAKISIYAGDVDSCESTNCGEWDLVYVNGVEVGWLVGEENQWSTTTLDIPNPDVVFGSGDVEIEVDVDVYHLPGRDFGVVINRSTLTIRYWKWVED